MVIQKRIKVTENIVVSCKMIAVNQKLANRFGYAAIIFARKGQTDKAIEYNLSLNLLKSWRHSISLLMKTPNFFSHTKFINRHEKNQIH